MSWDHQEHLKSLPLLHQLQGVFFCHAKVAVDHHRCFITLIALIRCIRLVIFCDAYTADVNRQIGWALLVLGQWKSQESLFVLAIQQLCLSNHTFTHRQPQTHQVLCNYHLSSLRVVAEYAFCQMKRLRRAFGVKLKISLWFFNKNLLPCCVLQTLTAREAYDYKWWKQSQGRSIAMQACCRLFYLHQRIITKDVLMVCSVQSKSLLLAVKLCFAMTANR